MDNNSSRTQQPESGATQESLATKGDLDDKHESIITAIKEASASNRAWDILKAVLPILLTTLLGFWVWYTQNKIQSKVEESNRLLSTRLALTEEFYKRKLNQYEATSKEIADLEQSLEQYDERESDPTIGTRASNSMSAVDRLRKSDFLYLTDKFKGELGDLWDIGIDRMRSNGNDDTEIKKKLRDQIKQLKDEMNADLHTSDLGWLPQQSFK
jgi:hypothetical protein